MGPDVSVVICHPEPPVWCIRNPSLALLPGLLIRFHAPVVPVGWQGAPPGRDVLDASKTNLLAPILRPPKIICVGLNYRDHAEQSNLAIPEVPTIFSKFPDH